MGELPVFTCQAHVFTINPKTKKSWVPSSSKAVDINFFYDSTKQCYRIISVEDGSTGRKMIVNCTVTEKMTFKKTSQKFGQWADSKTGGVHGLGFNSEAELTEFVNHFKHCVEACKDNASTSTSSNGRTAGNESSPSSSTVNSLPTTQLLSPPSGGVFQTIHTTAANENSSSDTLGSQLVYLPQTTSLQIQQQLKKAQAQINRLESELNATKRQASISAGFPLDSNTGPSPFFMSDVCPITENGGSRLTRTNSLSVSSPTDGTNELRDGLTALDINGQSVMNGAGEDCTTASITFVPTLKGSNPVPLPNHSSPRRTTNWTTNMETVRSLHSRLGYVLREAVELHARLGALLPQGTPGAPPE